jgi:molybdate transport system ATP-binding protein
VLFDSTRRVDLPPQAREMAYVFQDYALFPHLTVRQNIAFPLVPWLGPIPRAAATAMRWTTGWHALRARQAGGPVSVRTVRRNNASARRSHAHWLRNPRALLLDEPFAALDPALRNAMRRELDRLQQRLQVPMVLITHDPEDAAVLGEQVLHLHDGRLLGAQATGGAVAVG